MAENQDYEEILSGTVEEAKNQIRELEDPDLEKLLEKEIKGDNRKTLRTWIEDELKEKEPDKEEPGGIVSSLSPAPLAVGVLVGLLVGFAAATTGPLASTGPGVDRMNPDQVSQDVVQLVESGRFNGTAEASRPVVQNGLYRVNVTMYPEGNRSATSQEVYVTLDGQLLVPIRRNPLTGQIVSPIPLQQRIAQSQSQ